MWTKQQCIEEANRPSRIKAVEVFTANWMKNQNGRGACAGYAGASAVERARKRRGLKHVVLSGDGLYAAVNGGRDQGAMLEDCMRWILKYGVPPAALVPVHEYRKNRISAEAYKQGERFKGLEGFTISTELGLTSALAAGFDTVIAAHAGNGGLSSDDLIQWTNGPGNHSIVCDDFRWTGNQFEFEIANSWGLNWGRQGRGWLTWNRHLSNPVTNHMFYAFRSVTDDPEDDNAPTPRGLQ